MAARSGQRGYVFKNGKFWVVRFRIDVGQFERKMRYVRLCPIEGEGALPKTERYRKALDLIAQEGANSEKKFYQTESSGLTFREQSQVWLTSVSNRKRRPVKAHTLTSWRSHLVWLNSKIADMPLSAINNGVMRNLVTEMHEAGFKPKTMLNYLQVVKAVVASLMNDDGEPVFPRKWNHDFIDVPVVKNQHQPTLSKDQIEAIINAATGWYRVLFPLLAGTGMRVGEALALNVNDVKESLICVRQSLYQRRLDTTKTEAGEREIDLAPELAEMLQAHVGTRSGFVFSTSRGGPIIQRNVLRVLHAVLKRLGMPKLGFHAFRRYRVTHLRKNMVPEDLIKFWIGHAPQTVTDVYSKVKSDTKFRREVAAKVGLGFKLTALMNTSEHNFSELEHLQAVEINGAP